MSQKNNGTTQVTHPASLVKCALIGGAIALALISLFLFPIKNVDPAWGKMWMLRPLVIVTLAGATGGAFYYFMGSIRNQGGWKKILANAISLVVYIVGLWLGTVLGLNGTLWN